MVFRLPPWGVLIIELMPLKGKSFYTASTVLLLYLMVCHLTSKEVALAVARLTMFHSIFLLTLLLILPLLLVHHVFVQSLLHPHPSPSERNGRLFGMALLYFKYH